VTKGEHLSSKKGRNKKSHRRNDRGPKGRRLGVCHAQNPEEVGKITCLGKATSGMIMGKKGGGHSNLSEFIEQKARSENRVEGRGSGVYKSPSEKGQGRGSHQNGYWRASSSMQCDRQGGERVENKKKWFANRKEGGDDCKTGGSKSKKVSKNRQAHCITPVKHPPFPEKSGAACKSRIGAACG